MSGSESLQGISRGAPPPAPVESPDLREKARPEEAAARPTALSPSPRGVGERIDIHHSLPNFPFLHMLGERTGRRLDLRG